MIVVGNACCLQYQEEPEPEWMEFGPTDRFDVIELRGFEDEEEESLNSEFMWFCQIVLILVCIPLPSCRRNRGSIGRKHCSIDFS